MDLLDPFDFQNLVLELRDRIEKLEARGKKKPSESAPLREAFLQGYEKEFNRKYPKWGARENTILKNWGASVGIERGKELIKLYFSWRSPFVVRRGHTLELLAQCTVELVAWAEDGKAHAKRISEAQAMEEKILKPAGLLEEMREIGRDNIQQEGRAKENRRLHGGEIQTPGEPFIPRDGDH